MRDKVVKAVRDGHSIFVDSGAFSLYTQAVREGRDLSTYSLNDWIEVFDPIIQQYQALSQRIRSNEAGRRNSPFLMLVMPDVVGDQAMTQRLLKHYKNDIQALEGTNHEFIVPIQVGKTSPSDFYKWVRDAIFDSTPNFVAGIPSSKEAMSDAEFEQFLRETNEPNRLHILGAASPGNRRFQARMDAIRRIYGDEVPGVTADAMRLRGVLNRLQGLTGEEKKRAMTEALAEAVPEAFGGTGLNQVESTAGAAQNSLADLYASDRAPDRVAAQAELQEIYAEAYESIYGKAPSTKVLDRIRREVLDTPSPEEMIQNIRDEAQNPDISGKRRALHDAALDEIDLNPAKSDLATPRNLRANPELFADIEAAIEGLSAVLPNSPEVQQAKQQLADIRRNKPLAQPLSAQEALDAARGVSPSIDAALDDLAEATSIADSLDAVRRVRNAVMAAAKTSIPEARRAALDARREKARKQQRRRDERRAQRVQASREAVESAEQERAETEAIRERQAERAEAAGVRQADREKQAAIERSRREGPPPPLNREARKVGAKEWAKTSLTELRNLDPRGRRVMLYLNDLRRIAEKFRAVLKDRGTLKAPRYFLPNNKPKNALGAIIHSYTLRDVDRKRNIARANAILKQHWVALKPDRRDAVTWAAEQATLHEVQVDKPYTAPEHKHLRDLPNNEGITRFNQAMAAFDALSESEQSAYRALRDFMVKQREDTLVALARSVLYNSGLAYAKMGLGNTPTQIATRLKALQSSLTAEQIENLLLEDAPPTDRASVLATLEMVQGLLDAQETRGDYFPLRRSGDWVVEASSTYTLTDATEAGLKAKVAAAISDNPTLQTYSKAEQKSDGSWSVDIVDRVFELHESREHARARLADLKESGDYENVAAEPTRKQDWKPPRDSAAFELFSRLETRLPDDSRVQTALREVMMAHLLKRDLARGAVNRKKVKGYSREFGAAFGDWTLAQASYRGNLALAPVESKAKASIKDYADALKHRNDPDAQLVYDLLWRLEQQTEQDMRVNSPATQWLTKALSDVSMITFLGDLFYSVLNATQTVMFTIPAVLGKYGAVDGGKAIAKAMWDLGVDPIHLVGTTGKKVAGIPQGVVDYVKELRSRGTLMPEISLAPIAKEQKQSGGKTLILTDRENAVLSQEEREWVHSLRQTGLLDTKFAEYVEASKAIAGESVSDQVSKEWNQMLSVMRQLPESVEYANRGIVGLATMRLEKARGAKKQQAVEMAASMTNSTQFDYAEWTRPLFMRGPVKSNIFRYRMFSIGVAQWAGRVIDGMRRNHETTPFKTKAEAAKTAGWFMTMAWLLSGAKGSMLIQPIVWPLMAVAKALGLEGPCLHDPTTCVYNHLAENYGEDTAELVMNGPVDYLSGASISDRVGFEDLLFFGDVPDVDEHGALDKAIVTALGPTVSLGKDWGTALFGEGEAADRAQTRILPKPVRNVVKAMDLSEEVIETYSHGRRLAPEDISSRGLFWQGLGVSPTEVSRYWDTKNRLDRSQEFYDEGRKKVFLANKDARLDVRHNPTDKDARKRVQEALEELQAWNRRVVKEGLAPSLRLSVKDVDKAVKRELKKERQVERTGVAPKSKQRQRELEAGYFGR